MLTIRDWQQDGLAAEDICVVARTGHGRDQAATALRNAGATAVVVADAAHDDEPGVRVMTMHRAKGLEFRAIAVVGANDPSLTPRLSPPTRPTRARSWNRNAACYTSLAPGQGNA